MQIVAHKYGTILADTDVRYIVVKTAWEYGSFNRGNGLPDDFLPWLAVRADGTLARFAHQETAEVWAGKKG